MKIYKAIGLMSGTSMDGIDVALVETDGESIVRRGPSGSFAYDSAFRRRIEAALETAKSIRKREDRPGDLASLELDITLRHATAVQGFLEEFAIDAASVDVIGFHGQTVLHRPQEALTVQIGNGALLAGETGIPVVHDMRANDMAHGGQGAPLVPVYHQALAASFGNMHETAFVNIGGISNVTFVGPGHNPVAFDCGPGNTLIDQWVQATAGIPYDDGGRIACEGQVDKAIVAQVLALPYFNAPPPKSLDRNDFSPELVEGLDLSDGARTLAAITAEAVFKACDHAPARPGTWIVCGGGRKNRSIMNHLSELAEKVNQRVLVSEDAGFNGDSMEAEAWAYLAVRSLNGLPLTYPETTGARIPVTGGVLSRPKF